MGCCFILGNDERENYSMIDYADVLLNRLEDAHSLTREHLQVIVSRMQDWYDKKLHVQEFKPGDEVYLLNVQLYQGRCPKWIRRYTDMAIIRKKINQVTYVMRCDKWRDKTKSFMWIN